MRTVVQYAVPAVVAASAWIALIAGAYRLARWTRQRKAKPGYAPFWALAYVLLIVAGATVCSVFVVALGSRGQGRHRRVAVGRRAAKAYR